MEYFQARLFLAYLILTILMETPVLVVVIRHFFKLAISETPTSKIVFTGVLASLTTYPYLWYVFPALAADYNTAMVTGEIFVILVESLIIQGVLRLPHLQSLAVSCACNLTSIFLGTLMNKLIVQYRLFLWEN